MTRVVRFERWLRAGVTVIAALWASSGLAAPVQTILPGTAIPKWVEPMPRLVGQPAGTIEAHLGFVPEHAGHAGTAHAAHVRGEGEHPAHRYARAGREARDLGLGVPRGPVPGLHGGSTARAGQLDPRPGDRRAARGSDRGHVREQSRRHRDDERARLQDEHRPDAALGGSALPEPSARSRVHDEGGDGRVGRRRHVPAAQRPVRLQLLGSDPRGSAPARRRDPGPDRRLAGLVVHQRGHSRLRPQVLHQGWRAVGRPGRLHVSERPGSGAALVPRPHARRDPAQRLRRHGGRLLPDRPRPGSRAEHAPGHGGDSRSSSRTACSTRTASSSSPPA